MEDSAEIRDAVAGYFQIEAESLHEDFPIGSRLTSSLAKYSFASAMRRTFGILPAEVLRANTLGELEQLFKPHRNDVSTGSRIDAAEEPSASHDLDSRNLKADGEVAHCGVDLDEIDVLPTAEDFWEHPFFRESFTDAEIAYCQLKQDPRPHFLARWCAKEACKKCFPELLTVAPNQIEIRLDERGRPRLWLYPSSPNSTVEPLPCDVSLSHTSRLAAAVVVAAPKIREVATALPASKRNMTTDFASQRKEGNTTFWISLIALAIGMSALVLEILSLFGT